MMNKIGDRRFMYAVVHATLQNIVRNRQKKFEIHLSYLYMGIDLLFTTQHYFTSHNFTAVIKKSVENFNILRMSIVALLIMYS